MFCPSCGGANAEGAGFCSSCGSSLTLACSTCGKGVAPGAEFCDSCGTSVADEASQTLVGVPAVDALPASFASDRYVVNGLLGKGATKVVPVSVQQQNPEVLTTLRSLTKHDFGYNEKAWQRWWNVDRQQSKLAPDLP